MMMAMLVAVYLNYLMPENVFLMFASLATFTTVWVWIMILCSQIAFRLRLKPEQVMALKFSLSGGAITAGLGVVFLLFIIGWISYFPTTQVSLYVGAVWILLLLLGYRWVKTKRVTAC